MFLYWDDDVEGSNKKEEIENKITGYSDTLASLEYDFENKKFDYEQLREELIDMENDIEEYKEEIFNLESELNDLDY